MISGNARHRLNGFFDQGKIVDPCGRCDRRKAHLASAEQALTLVYSDEPPPDWTGVQFRNEIDPFEYNLRSHITN